MNSAPHRQIASAISFGSLPTGVFPRVPGGSGADALPRPWQTLLFCPHMAQRIREYPIIFLVPVLKILALANVPREIYHGRDFLAFLSSCVTIIGLMFLFGFGLFPSMIASNPNIANSLTIYNAASSQKTLSIMLTIALVGMPIVLAYTFSIYWIFRGKVKINEMSY